jgi:hypothetical protein
MSGASTTSEGTLAQNLDVSRKSSRLAKLHDKLHYKLLGAINPLASAWAVPSCNWSSVISACSNDSETLTFDSCSSPLDPAIRIRGSESLSWTGANCCNANPLAASSATPCSFVRRTTDSTGASDPMILSIGSNAIALDTETPSGFEKNVSGGFRVACIGTTQDPTCNGQREITIMGAHYTGKTDRSQWDHTVTTDAPLMEQGHGAGRKILSGTVRVQHNLAQVTSVTTIQSPLTHSAGCCYPTGGSVSTTFSGGKMDGKTETMEFTSKCGEVQFTDVTSKQTGLTLHHCL